MNLDYIEFETALLARNKGFDGIGETAYSLDGKSKISTSSSFYNPLRYPIEDCLQVSLQKWLREIHKIEVIVAPKFNNDKSLQYCYECLLMSVNNEDTMKSLFRGIFWLHPTYEEALEKGLIEGLNLIK